MKIMNLKDSNIDLSKIRQVSYRTDDKIEFKTKELIPITSDVMFKALFQREENIKFPCKLLSYLLDISYEELLDNLKFTKTETGKKHKDELSYRQDLVVSLDDVTINIEMNNNSNEEIRERNISYLMRLRVDKKTKQYHQVIQINLNNYCYKDDLSIRRDYCFMDQDQNILTNKIVIIDIYLPNIKKKSYNKDNLSEMEKFLLIGLEENPKKALEYVGDDVVMKELNSRISEFCLSDDLRESYDKEWALKDQAKREGFIDGKREGFVDGKLEGKRESESRLITQFLASGMSVEEISKITKLSTQYILDLTNN